MATDIFKILHTTQTKEVSDGVRLEVYIQSTDAVTYRFVDDDGLGDTPMLSALEKAYDDHLEVETYCFHDLMGGTHYLSEFE